MKNQTHYIACHKRLSAVGPIRTGGYQNRKLKENTLVTNAFRLLVRSGRE